MSNEIRPADENHSVVMDYLEDNGIDTAIFEPFELGKQYYLRMLVYSVVGRVTGYSRTGRYLRLDNAHYVATDGRFGAACREGFPESAELEYCGERVVNLDNVNDFGEYPHQLPNDDQ